MKITLSRISHNKRLSEETHAYSADLIVDGKKVAEVSNHGHGGCDHVRWNDKAHVTEEQVEAFVAATYPALFISDGKPFPASLESVCANLVNDYLSVKDFTRMLKTKVVAISGTDTVSWNLKRAPTSSDVEAIKARNPKYANARFLNGMDEAGLLALVHELRAEDKANRGW